MRIFTLSLALALPFSLAAQVDLGRVLPAGQALHIAALGDYGSGSRHQKEVAKAMQERNRQDPFTLGITMGDNFYRCGVRSVHDSKWETRWEDLYTPLGVLFYASLGNHDYGHPPIVCPLGGSSARSEIARTELSKSWRMPAKYYTFAAGPVRFIAIDTEGWSEEQLAWIKKTLADTADEPGVRWRIVYGHHPMYTSGVHLNQRRIGALRRDLLPVLREAHVDLYICGHDHDMERLESGAMDFLISGTGGAELRKIRHAEPESVFRDSRYGFIDVHVDENRLAAEFLDVNLKGLEEKPLVRTK